MNSYGELSTRPSKLNPNKDESYHLQMAKWYCENNSMFDHKHQMGKLKSSVNWAFYKGNQWIFDEDLDPFLLDESGETRNRIRWVNNIIKPIVNHYSGTSIRLGFNAVASSISMEASIRRKTEESAVIALTDIAQQMPAYADAMKRKFNIGDNREETQRLFDATYTDKYVKGINKIVQSIASKNKLLNRRPMLAENLALDGIAIMKEEFYNFEQTFRYLDPKFFFFDRSCKMPDLSDAEFMGEDHHMLPTQIYERWQSLTPEQREEIESLAKYFQQGASLAQFYNGLTPIGNRMNVKEVYWVDSAREDYGFFVDDYNELAFERIDGKQFTPANAVVPDEPDLADILNNNGKIATIYTDDIRYCIYVPISIHKGKREGYDVVFDHGKYMYSGEDSLDRPTNQFPYKVHTWGYKDGEIITPVDDLVSPQRYINRLLSVAEGHVNNARGAGPIIDRSVVDDEDGEEGIVRSMNLGKPLFVDAKRQINNSIGQYGSGLDNKMIFLYDLASKIKDMAGDSVGFNSELSGIAQSYRSSTSIAMNNLNQGSIMQEPIYFALSEILKQCYEAIANNGIKFYSKNKRRLRSIVGDDLIEVFTIQDNYQDEKFEFAIERSQSKLQELEVANQALIMFLQMQLIDDQAFANAFNKSNMTDVGAILREASAQRAVQRMQQEKAQRIQNNAAAAGSILEQQQNDLSQVEQNIMQMANEELKRGG